MFIGIVTSQVAIVKTVGIGLTLAVLVDAFLIRATLVPAFMKMAGRLNWWSPRSLRRWHLRYGIWENEPIALLDRQFEARVRWPLGPAAHFRRRNRSAIKTLTRATDESASDGAAGAEGITVFGKMMLAKAAAATLAVSAGVPAIAAITSVPAPIDQSVAVAPAVAPTAPAVAPPAAEPAPVIAPEPAPQPEPAPVVTPAVVRAAAPAARVVPAPTAAAVPPRVEGDEDHDEVEEHEDEDYEYEYGRSERSHAPERDDD